MKHCGCGGFHYTGCKGGVVPAVELPTPDFSTPVQHFHDPALLEIQVETSRGWRTLRGWVGTESLPEALGRLRRFRDDRPDWNTRLIRADRVTTVVPS